MNALFSAYSKLKSTTLVIQEAKHALGQNCANNGDRRGLGGGGLGGGARFGHIGSYRRGGCFSQGSRFKTKHLQLSCKKLRRCAIMQRRNNNQGLL
jgi:hypothetical protein